MAARTSIQRAGESDGEADSAAFPQASFVADHENRGIGFRHLADHFARAVVTVGGDDDLIAGAAVVKVLNRFTNGVADGGGFVECGKDQADVGCFRHSFAIVILHVPL